MTEATDELARVQRDLEKALAALQAWREVAEPVEGPLKCVRLTPARLRAAIEATRPVKGLRPAGLTEILNENIREDCLYCRNKAVKAKRERAERTYRKAKEFTRHEDLLDAVWSENESLHAENMRLRLLLESYESGTVRIMDLKTPD